MVYDRFTCLLRGQSHQFYTVRTLPSRGIDIWYASTVVDVGL